MNIRDRSLSERLSEEIFTRIHQDIGQASMCWENVEGAGTFDSTKAAEIAFDLCHYIADKLEVTDNEKEVIRTARRWEDGEWLYYEWYVDDLVDKLEDAMKEEK